MSAPDFLAELSRIQRRVMGLPEPLVRLDDVLERMMCRHLSTEERRQFRAEYLELTRLPWEQAA